MRTLPIIILALATATPARAQSTVVLPLPGRQWLCGHPAAAALYDPGPADAGRGMNDRPAGAASGSSLTLSALSTAAMILSGLAVQTKGFGCWFVSARKRLMAALSSYTWYLRVKRFCDRGQP
jgi:hypothetical protein